MMIFDIGTLNAMQLIEDCLQIELNIYLKFKLLHLYVFGKAEYDINTDCFM